VADRAMRTRARCLIVDVPDGWAHPGFSFATSHPEFKAAQARRSSDLSLKRNLGMMLARLHGWNKIVFGLDQDLLR
jgi:hypothetical protein